jgi:Protein of unknown function with PCYCGC motif
MEKIDGRVHFETPASELTKRRSFLTIGALTIMTLASARFFRPRIFAAATHRYKLAPESILPADIRQAPADVREAYRFAVANRNTLRYIPCYCGCVAEGHTSNASCYIKDDSTPEKPVFDRMSLG